MVTIRFNALGLILAGAIIFVGLAIPMGKSEGDGWIGFIYAGGMVLLAAMMYLMSIGLATLIG